MLSWNAAHANSIDHVTLWSVEKDRSKRKAHRKSTKPEQMNRKIIEEEEAKTTAELPANSRHSADAELKALQSLNAHLHHPNEKLLKAIRLLKAK